MAVKSRALLKSVFVTGAKPTQQDFVDLFDSFWHLADQLLASGLTQDSLNRFVTDSQIAAWNAKAPDTGSANYVQIQNTVAQPGSYWMLGNGQVNGTQTAGWLRLLPQTAALANTLGIMQYKSSTNKLEYYDGAVQNVASESYVKANAILSGNTIYVKKNAPNATDVRTGISNYSESTPFKTIQSAINVALNGDRIVVDGGSYSESLGQNNGIYLFFDFYNATVIGSFWNFQGVIKAHNSTINAWVDSRYGGNNSIVGDRASTLISNIFYTAGNLFVDGWGTIKPQPSKILFQAVGVGNIWISNCENVGTTTDNTTQLISNTNTTYFSNIDNLYSYGQMSGSAEFFNVKNFQCVCNNTSLWAGGAPTRVTLNNVNIRVTGLGGNGIFYQDGYSNGTIISIDKSKVYADNGYIVYHVITPNNVTLSRTISITGSQIECYNNSGSNFPIYNNGASGNALGQLQYFNNVDNCGAAKPYTAGTPTTEHSNKTSFTGFTIKF